MLLVLEESLVEPIRAREPATTAGLENLLIGVYNGHHCLSVAPALATVLMQAQVLSGRATAVINAAGKSYAQREATWRALRAKLYISGTEQPPRRLDEWSWRYPAEAFHYKSPVATTLLAENLTDARVYWFAARHYAVANRVSALSTELACKGGGGSTTCDELQEIVDRATEFCLSVTDSDIEYPGGSAKHTARRCETIATDTPWIVSHVTLAVRELENLFPRRVLEAALDAGLNNRIADLFRLCNTEPSVLLYTDVKHGVSLGAVLWLPDGSPRKEYWTHVVEGISAIDPGRRDCGAPAQCDVARNCNCELLPGVGPEACAQVLEWLRGRSIHASFREFSDAPTLVEWGRVGRVVFEAGCATPRMRL